MPLSDCHILVVEDEYLLAQDLCRELQDAGAVVIGPEGSVKGALARISAEPRIDAAVLDVNLGDEPVFPVAEVLADRAVPFLFASGYGDVAFIGRFSSYMKCPKPLDMRALLRSLGKIVRKT